MIGNIFVTFGSLLIKLGKVTFVPVGSMRKGLKKMVGRIRVNSKF